MISGIINVLKPAGITSNYVLNVIKKKLRPNKIGHLGTLDPSGVGVLPVCINKGTKLFDYFLKKDKVYRTIFVFGKETDTLDSDGIIIKTDNIDVKSEQILTVISKLVGKQDQIPPNYSAKKISGQKAYELARKNVEFELKPKQVEIYALNLLAEISHNAFLFEVKCSSGTYIRSIVRDMAKMLGTVGYVGAIIRTESGMFAVKNAVLLGNITENNILPLEKILKNGQKVFVQDEFYDKILNGNQVEVDFENAENCIAFCRNELVGIGKVKDGFLKINTNLWEKND